MGETTTEIPVRQRILWGSLGGLVAVFSKFFAQDHYWLRVMIDTNSWDEIPGMATFYLLLLIGLCIMGAVIAAATRETSEMKLLAIAVAAPALITTWLGGERSSSRAWLDNLIPSANAQTVSKQPRNSGFWEGFKIPLGYGKDQSRYRVVVGSYKDRTEAAMMVERIKKEAPHLNAYVGERQPGNDFYAVIIGDYLPYPEASALLSKVNGLNAVNDAFLSPYRWR